MKEGRKCGIAVIVASQRIDDFHGDVSVNAGMKLIFRMNFPASKAIANFLRPRDGQDLGQRVEQLDARTAYISTPDEVRARRVTMTR